MLIQVFLWVLLLHQGIGINFNISRLPITGMVLVEGIVEVCGDSYCAHGVRIWWGTSLFVWE